MSADRHVRHLVAHGRVQGVFFRASTVRQAERHGVTGWVYNRPDGAVEAWLEGPRDGVEAVERWIRAGGPPAGRVDQVDVLDDATPQDHTTFQVRRA